MPLLTSASPPILHPLRRLSRCRAVICNFPGVPVGSDDSFLVTRCREHCRHVSGLSPSCRDIQTRDEYRGCRAGTTILCRGRVFCGQWYWRLECQHAGQVGTSTIEMEWKKRSILDSFHSAQLHIPAYLAPLIFAFTTLPPSQNCLTLPSQNPQVQIAHSQTPPSAPNVPVAAAFHVASAAEPIHTQQPRQANC